MNEEKTTRPDCFECKHRGTVPGSSHSSCGHPSIGKIDALVEVMGILASVGRALPVKVDNKLNIKGNPHGIRNGWFNWPMNFDPCWLEQCDGFTTKEVNHVTNR